MIPRRRQSDTICSSDYIFLPLVAWLFLWQLSLGPNVKVAIYALGVIPAEACFRGIAASRIEMGQPWKITVITSMFLHGGFVELIGNMLSLSGFLETTLKIYWANRFYLILFALWISCSTRSSNTRSCVYNSNDWCKRSYFRYFRRIHGVFFQNDQLELQYHWVSFCKS